MSPHAKLLLRNQALIMRALAEITFRTVGVDQSVCDDLWRATAETKRHLGDEEQAQS